MLKDEADVAVAGRGAGDVFVLVKDRARVGRFQPGDDPQQRGLARPRRPEQRQQRALLDIQADVVERHEIAEALGDVLDGNAHATTCSPTACNAAASARSRRVLRSSQVLTASVTRASNVNTEATANEAGMLYS